MTAIRKLNLLKEHTRTDTCYLSVYVGHYSSFDNIIYKIYLFTFKYTFPRDMTANTRSYPVHIIFVFIICIIDNMLHNL